MKKIIIVLLLIVLPVSFGYELSYKGDVNQSYVNETLNSIDDYFFENLKYIVVYDCVPSKYFGYNKWGLIWINMCRLQEYNLTLREALGHELGHLYWFYELPRQEKIEWCKFTDTYGYQCKESFANGFGI